MIKKAKLHRLSRKWHRYLGLLLGIQFLAWTLGGLYFSWTKIEEIRGDDIRKKNPPLTINGDFVPISSITKEIGAKENVDAIESIQMIDILGKTCYQIAYNSAGKKKTQLADAQTGTLREPLSESEAVLLAKSRLTKNAEAKSVEYLINTNGHHEYRAKPLPAYAVRFEGEVNTTVYVSSELGTVQSFRNNQWRVFDFLWMLHTMDYENRDNLNNWLLRIFSVFGLVTILSGFVLFFVSSPPKKRRHTRARQVPPGTVQL